MVACVSASRSQIHGVSWQTRGHRPKRRGFLESAGLAVRIVFTNSRHPLQLATVGSLLCGLLGAAGAVFFAARGAAGLPLALVSAMLGFLFVTLSILGVYVGQLLDESKDRPLYHLMQEQDSAVTLDESFRRNVVSESVTDS